MSPSGRLPLVAIPLRPEAREGVPRRMFQNRVYFEAIEAAGAAVMPVPLSADEERLRLLYDRCEAVCLAGGPDVVPALYGEATCEDCAVETAPELDTVDFVLARWALAEGKPLLGICRGMQVLNVALGGTLWQDVGMQVPGALPHWHDERNAVAHPIDVARATRLHDIVRASSALVNSLHHQALRSVAAGLVVTARAPDGVVEAVEHTTHRFAVALQCHPEELHERHPWASRLFQEFISSARA